MWVSAAEQDAIDAVCFAVTSGAVEATTILVDEVGAETCDEVGGSWEGQGESATHQLREGAGRI
jgi:hypothetical protein